MTAVEFPEEKSDPWSTFRRMRYECRCFVSRYPRLYLPIVRHKYRSRPNTRVIDAETEIVIDGFPRSGNTFAWAAFTLAQSRPISIAHHIHAPAQILQGVRLRRPVILLIRDSDDVVLSWKIYSEYLTFSQVLRQYIAFYKALEAHRDHVVVGDFATITTDFGKIIGAVNDRFGTSFAEFLHTEENVGSCIRLIEQRATATDPRIRERRVPRPYEARSRLKEQMRIRYDLPELRDLRAQARNIYDLFTRPSKS